jgi:hypothetical protein
MSPYELVDSEKAAFPVGALCEAVGVSRSAFYAWRRSTPSARKVANERLLAEIRAIHVENKARYGSPRMRDELKGRGHEAGKHRVAHQSATAASFPAHHRLAARSANRAETA